jgi:hypothetical protein
MDRETPETVIGLVLSALLVSCGARSLSGEVSSDPVVDCAFPREPFTITTNTHPVSELATAATYIYYIERLDPTMPCIAIRRVPKRCGPVETIISSRCDMWGGPRALAVDGDSVYWTTADGVSKTPVIGGAIETFTTLQGAFRSVDSSLYLTNEANGKWAVYELPRGGGQTLLAPDAVLDAIDDKNFYLDKYTPTNEQKTSFVAATRDGGVVRELVQCSALGVDCPANVVSDGMFIYFTLPSIAETLFRMAVAGGPRAAVTTTWHWISVATDTQYLYAYDHVNVVHVPTKGGMPATLAKAKADEGIQTLVFDGEALYWVANGNGNFGGSRIMKLAVH